MCNITKIMSVESSQHEMPAVANNGALQSYTSATARNDCDEKYCFTSVDSFSLMVNALPLILIGHDHREIN